eukprot:m.82519 g.82519  ORF g.82519 m.82519 type:complete len:65 (-) comp9473_c0_seq1:376-570(-)
MIDTIDRLKKTMVMIHHDRSLMTRPMVCHTQPQSRQDGVWFKYVHSRTDEELTALGLPGSDEVG